MCLQIYPLTTAKGSNLTVRYAVKPKPVEPAPTDPVPGEEEEE